MNRYMVCVGSVALALLLGAVTLHPETRAQAPSDEPQFTKGNQLVRPQNYREWIYLSSGLGMAYSKNANMPELFTNVFVTPSAYQTFQATGKWPDKTMFVLEERAASSKGSINKGGHYQADFVEIGASVKDEKRFEEKWAYFSFASNEANAAPNPRARCWQCHADHGAVDNTFVQFYPTLKEVALRLGTYDSRKAASENGGN